MNIRNVMTDPALFGEQFSGDTWAAWRALLAGFYGLELDDTELVNWKALTERSETPQQALAELWLVVGRRGGKSNIAALLAVFIACFFDYADRLAPGEVATVAVLAADRKQARSVFRYVIGLLHANPMTERMIIREDREAVELSNRTVIEVTTASYRATRGYSFAAVIADEIAFWRSEDSANPDFEIINAVRPGMATLGGKLIALSSPYSRRGALWDAYRRYFGTDSDILVAQAPTLTMNPNLPARLVDEAYERDAVAADAEYGAQFRNDIAAFISRDLVDNNTRLRPLMLPPNRTYRYFAFVDVAGGGADEYTMAIAHRENNLVVVDALYAEHGDPAVITRQYAQIMKTYGIQSCTGDRYGAEWPRQEYRKHTITLRPSKLNRSELYLELMPMLQTGEIELPPDERALTQFTLLERRTGRNGRDSIDHPPGKGSHDDRANAIAGVAQLAKASTKLWTKPIKVTFAF